MNYQQRIQRIGNAAIGAVTLGWVVCGIGMFKYSDAHVPVPASVHAVQQLEQAQKELHHYLQTYTRANAPSSPHIMAELQENKQRIAEQKNTPTYQTECLFYREQVEDTRTTRAGLMAGGVGFMIVSGIGGLAWTFYERVKEKEERYGRNGR